MNLALVGFGAVTRRFVELLMADGVFGGEHRLVGIATRSHGSAVDPNGISPRRALEAGAGEDGDLRSLHHDQLSPPGDTAAFLETVARVSEGDLVVAENTPLGLSGGQPGVDHVRQALSIGASVITANKGPAAFAYRELQALAARSGLAFLCEGAVLDGLPVFSLIRRTLPSLRVRGFRGIVNTTTNHVLTRMESGRHLEEALAEMQAAGIAEADPTNDIDGWDAAAKTAALANALMDADLTPHDVRRESIRQLTPETMRQARGRDERVKVVATAERGAEGVLASVGPVWLPSDDPLAHLHGTAKGLELDTDRLGRIHLGKRESGVDHTAYALLCDLAEVSRLRDVPSSHGLESHSR